MLRASAVAMVKEERVPRAETKVDERFKVSQDADWASNRRLWVCPPDLRVRRRGETPIV